MNINTDINILGSILDLTLISNMLNTSGKNISENANDLTVSVNLST